jgi:hypothetical protein
MTRKELEKFLYWLLHQRFMEMVSTIGVDGIAKKYLKETGEDKVALPLDVPCENEIEYKADKHSEFEGIGGIKNNNIAKQVSFMQGARWGIEETIKRNQK